MPHQIETLRLKPLSDDLRKSTQLGVEVILPGTSRLFDPDTLSNEDRNVLRQGLFDHGILVIRDQAGIEPQVLCKVAELFESNAKRIHSGGEKQVTNPKNILSQNNCSRIPRAPQVTIIGQGDIKGHEGVGELHLKHLDHTSFHESPLSQAEIESGKTRPYRWHMDAPLYENLPGFVTAIHAIDVPDLPDQELQFPRAQSMPIAAGATAFFSGARNFELLSPEEQTFALNTTIQYAPRAYEWMRDCKATSDGLSIEKVGREKPFTELEPWTWANVQSFPMVWKNTGNGRPHLQILGCCVLSLLTTDPATGDRAVIDDLSEVRRICHGFQSKAYSPENVYAHRWRKGDLVIFHNRGVMHTITGQLAQLEVRRLMWQCNMASNTPVEAYRT